jgi:hypothetical protein
MEKLKFGKSIQIPAQLLPTFWEYKEGINIVDTSFGSTWKELAVL